MSSYAEEDEIRQIEKKDVNVALQLPWNLYNKQFKVVKLIDDQMSHAKYYVKCIHCAGPKTLCADTRSTSNLRKHLAVSNLLLIIGYFVI